MHNCDNCKAMEEALDLLSKELENQRRRKRDLIRTIRLLKRSIINDMEQEHAAEVNRPIYSPLYVNRFFTGLEIEALSQADGHVED